MKLKYAGTNDGIVYYLVAFITTVTLATYIYAGEVVPLVGFLLMSSLVFALYPNKSIALVSGVLTAAMLRTPGREGMDPTATPENAPVDPEPNESDATKPKEKETTDANKLIADAMKAAKNINQDNLSVEPTKANYENKGSSKISPSELKDVSSKDMEQLSNIIDKTTDLIKMLPEGFLSKI